MELGDETEGLNAANSMAQLLELFAQEPGLDQYRVSDTDTEPPADKVHASSYRPP